MANRGLVFGAIHADIPYADFFTETAQVHDSPLAKRAGVGIVERFLFRVFKEAGKPRWINPSSRFPRASVSLSNGSIIC